ncbi:MAG: esterase/lipase family protein [Pseudomonadota bacterium]
MLFRLRPLLLLLLLLPSHAALADVVVLLQGYLGNDDPWRRSGVATALRTAGWADGGHLHQSPAGVRGFRPADARTFYTLALPTEAPLMGQLRHLEPLMQAVSARHSGERLILVGHSAGGVLARLFMVRHPQQPVAALITIASPHLGTPVAEAGAMAGASPLGWIAPLVGADSLPRSHALYRDLMREHPGGLLFWLNRQPHPPRRYISVVRRGAPLPWAGDAVVPPWSQDLNRVQALRGQALTLYSDGDHALAPADGAMLLALLRKVG